MHYIPESTTEMLQGESACGMNPRSNFHLQSAPLYTLTVIVASLLLADALFSSQSGTATSGLPHQASLLGYRFALLAAVLGGGRILYHSLDGLLSGRIGADLALTLACLAAIGLGEHQTAGLVVLISLVGESIEGYTVDRARWAVRKTFSLCPDVAHRQQDGREQDIPTAELRIGDVVTVRPGERIPVDGQIINGSSTVDQSQFTGESFPVNKTTGDAVFAGTLNQLGSLTVLSKSIGENTRVAEVARLVFTATARKAEIERIADRLARWFLPAVLIAAIATLLGWRIAAGSWSRGYLPALAVLVVACPCPLILATPCAVMAILASLARRGIIVKGSSALERLANVDTFAFDKTGTLTQGALELGEIIPLHQNDKNTILRMAAIAERNSEHLIGRILVVAAEKQGLSVPFPLDFKITPGAGVIASVRRSDLSIADRNSSALITPDAVESKKSHDDSDNRSHKHDSERSSILVGNRRALNEAGIEFSAEVATLLKDRELAGESPIVVAIDGTVGGVIGIRESIRPESKQVLDELQSIGISRFLLLTGDRAQQADAVVRSVGIFEQVATDMLPADKAAWIDSTRQSGRKVAMVGDGINDAPALAAADVGMALGRAGGDLAAAAGDIILLGDPLRPLPGLVRASRALVQNVWQSILLFAFGLNAIGILACSFRWLDPIGGAVYHEFASLAVMANATRLLWFDGWGLSNSPKPFEHFLIWADRLAGYLSPSQWIYWGIERWQLGLKLVVAIAMAGWLFSGVQLLTSDEEAIVTRFGRVESQLKAGLHWRWPWPLERVYRQNVDHVRSVTIGYRRPDHLSRDGMPGSTNVQSRSLRQRMPFNLWRANLSSQTASGSQLANNRSIIEWTSEHDNQEVSRNDESVMLTADEVPVELTAEVQYRIHNLKDFLFSGSHQPDEVIRACAENVVREVAASAILDNLLTDQRAQLERRSFNRLKDQIERYHLGVEILDLQWLDVHPPRAVVPDYRQVADALEEQELSINQAEAYSAATLLATVGERAYMILQSSIRRPDSGLTESKSDWQLNDDLWKRLAAVDANGNSLLSGSAAAILLEGQADRVRLEMQATGSSNRFQQLFTEYSQQPHLTINHLYWKSVVELLAPRTLTIIDPKAAGRQQIWLGDSIPPMPVLPNNTPREQTPP